MLSVDAIFSNLRNRTNRLNLFQFCFVLLLVSIFNFISRNLLPCKKFAFSKLTVSRAGFTTSCDDGEGGERGRFELTPYNFKSTNAAATKITQNNLFIVANLWA